MGKTTEPKSPSPLKLRLKRFRRLKRGYYSFLLLASLYLFTFFLPFVMNSQAIAVKYDGKMYFPAFRTYIYDTFGGMIKVFNKDLQRNIYLGKEFGQTTDLRDKAILGEAKYRDLKVQFAEADEGNWVWMPPIPYNPTENFLQEAQATESPSRKHWLGTDKSGRDVLVRLSYGFRISITFALVVTSFSYVVGLTIGSILGYFGGWVDIIGQRLVEIWGAVPFLYTVIILAAIFDASFMLLAVILSAFGWMSISYYIRGEFYREKAKDYVAAAIATGENNFAIITRHIFPNALTPVITFAPFAIVTAIVLLVSLDYLGYGLPVPTPSWGSMISETRDVGFKRGWHLVVFPLTAMFLSLQLIVFIGEAVREAFDPKVFSRLR